MFGSCISEHEMSIALLDFKVLPSIPLIFHIESESW